MNIVPVSPKEVRHGMKVARWTGTAFEFDLVIDRSVPRRRFNELGGDWVYDIRLLKPDGGKRKMTVAARSKVEVQERV